MTERFAHRSTGAGDVDLCFETFGDASDPTILLIMGLGGPMNWWDSKFCQQLAGRGFQVVRYDNRDTGHSTWLRQHYVSRRDLVRAAVGRGTAPYSLSDMAEDALAILDELGVAQAHIVGISMGGMIGQTLAIEHAERMLSLTSIMSTTGRRTVGWQHPKLIPNLLAPADRTVQGYAENSAKIWRRIGSPGYPFDYDALIARAMETFERGYSNSGVLRHMAAVLSQPNRTRALGKLSIPVTVIHGKQDPMVHPSGGRATARAVPGAELLEIDGMGHDLPEPLWDTIIDAIVRTTDRTGSHQH